MAKEGVLSYSLGGIDVDCCFMGLKTLASYCRWIWEVHQH